MCPRQNAHQLGGGGKSIILCFIFHNNLQNENTYEHVLSLNHACLFRNFCSVENPAFSNTVVRHDQPQNTAASIHHIQTGNSEMNIALQNLSCKEI